MGYTFVVGDCYICKNMFTFNPIKVPSIRDENNVRQPVCRNCIEAANKMKAEKDMELFVIPEDAYVACNEDELN